MTTAVAAPPSSRIVELPVAHLAPGPDVRIDDDPEELADLAASVSALGVLVPLVVRRAGRQRWEVIAGRRRLAAARHAGLVTVPCCERSCDDDEALDVAIAENLHRRRLSPLEQALAFQAMHDRGLTHKEIAARAGRSDFHVSVILRVLKLPAALQERIHRGEVGYTTVLDHPERYGLDGSYEYLRVRKGERTRAVPTNGDGLAAINHWRRRHDRIMGGVRALLRAPVGTDIRAGLRRLVKLDLEPLDTIASDPDWRERQFGKAKAAVR